MVPPSFLDAITRPEADRAALIERLSSRDDAQWLAEILIDLETDEIARAATDGGSSARAGVGLTSTLGSERPLTEGDSRSPHPSIRFQTPQFDRGYHLRRWATALVALLAIVAGGLATLPAQAAITGRAG